MALYYTARVNKDNRYTRDFLRQCINQDFKMNYTNEEEMKQKLKTKLDSLKINFIQKMVEEPHKHIEIDVNKITRIVQNNFAEEKPNGSQLYKSLLIYRLDFSEERSILSFNHFNRDIYAVGVLTVVRLNVVNFLLRFLERNEKNMKLFIPSIMRNKNFLREVKLIEIFDLTINDRIIQLTRQLIQYLEQDEINEIDIIKTAVMLIDEFNNELDSVKNNDKLVVKLRYDEKAMSVEEYYAEIDEERRQEQIFEMITAGEELVLLKNK
jgi:hypothetical protein